MKVFDTNGRLLFLRDFGSAPSMGAASGTYGVFSTTRLDNLLRVNSAESGGSLTRSQLRVTANNTGSVALTCFGPDNAGLSFDCDRVGGSWVARHGTAGNGSAALFYKYGNSFQIFGKTGLTSGQSFDAVSLFSLDLASGNLTLPGSIEPKMVFCASGTYGGPSPQSRSSGTKMVLWPAVQSGNSNLDYAMGIDTATFWFSVTAKSGSYFKWYGGDTTSAPELMMSLTNGVLDVKNDITVNGGPISGMVPLGGIIPWVKSPSGTPDIPGGGAFVECNGQLLQDSASVYNGSNLPDLNGATGPKGSVRESSTSGDAESDSPTESTDTTPPYDEVVYIMRVK